MNELSRGPNAESLHLLALGELLGRPAMAFDQIALSKLIRGRRVLVTGAGGSIGAELVRQVAALGPARLTLIENSEYNLYAIDQYLEERHPDISRCAAFCDIRDRPVVETWFERETPEVVFHAAALKHVPMGQGHPVESVRTNMLGTQNVADACAASAARVMVFVSTDKAVNPVSVMGATKRCAEAYCQAMDIEGEGTTRFVSVRFGNVFGSSGSVAPLFQRQIAEGGPITLTHPEATRYFMTLGEAVSLLLQAATLREIPGDLRGGLQVMDIGEPVRILDLARLMVRMAGRRPDDVDIRVIGLRPGEKLHEALVHEDETRILRTGSGLTLVAPRTRPLAELRAAFDRIARATVAFDDDLVRRLLGEMAPEYAPLDADSDCAADAVA